MLLDLLLLVLQVLFGFAVIDTPVAVVVPAVVVPVVLVVVALLAPVVVAVLFFLFFLCH